MFLFNLYLLFSGWMTCRENIYMFVYLLMFDLITNVLVLRQCNKRRSSSASGTHAGLPRLRQSNTEQRSVTPCMLSDCIMLYRICLCVLQLLIVSYCLSDKEKHERKREQLIKMSISLAYEFVTYNIVEYTRHTRLNSQIFHQDFFGKYIKELGTFWVIHFSLDLSNMFIDLTSLPNKNCPERIAVCLLPLRS